MNGRKPTEARNLSINALKSAGCVEHTLPGIIIIACHIIYSVVTCNYHKRPNINILKVLFFIYIIIYILIILNCTHKNIVVFQNIR